MKNRKQYTFIYILGAALIFSAGCKKYLEHAPDMRTKLNSVEKVGELLVSAYPKADYITFAESASDNAEDKGEGVGSEDQRYVDPYHWEDVDSRAQGSPTFYWNNSYEAIAAANQALAAIAEESDNEEYLPYKGEALVARAYAHFMLAVLYAKTYDPAGDNSSPGIPYVTEPETVVFGQYDRGTVASTYEMIEKDLEEGLPLIKNSAYNVPKYHFNIAAAHAFAARFYLFKGEYDKVIEHVNNIYPSGDFKSNLRPWATRYYSYGSGEMQINFTKATENSNLLLIETASLWARTTSPRFGFGIKMNTQLFINDNVTGTNFDHRIWSYGVPNYTLLKWREHFVRTSANATIGFPYTIVPVLTADEALMNRAEAYAEVGNFEAALSDINTFASTRIRDYNESEHAVTLEKIADFYATDDPKEGVVQTILDFKKAEFIQEGVRWFDILRHRLPVTHNLIDVNKKETFITLEPDDPRRLFQLPEEVEKSGIERNPR
ncbi:RagB/SusD family nutrient uptake outer membrane protein [Albibacterium profundi]|uniref:RagB/SusD family nutrient uptake outer membrane protein n=1 Tax=Albibacterium profundi TaxID=3134906 RepID=A0ABV5CCN8_9SPHI